MVVDFKSDNEALEYTGFSATIHFTLMQNKKCESWIDMNNGILESPNYPNGYGNDIYNESALGRSSGGARRAQWRKE